MILTFHYSSSLLISEPSSGSRKNGCSAASSEESIPPKREEVMWKCTKEGSMPIEIKVGPPTITISQGRTFMVTTQSGEIQANTDQGVYALDTRFLSAYRLYLNRESLQVVNSS